MKQNHHNSDRDVTQAVFRKLRTLAFPAKLMPEGTPFTIMVGKNRTIVLGADFDNNTGMWTFNLPVRRGATTKRESIVQEYIDRFVFALGGMPGHARRNVYVILPAPLSSPIQQFSFHTLLKKYAANVDNWELLK